MNIFLCKSKNYFVRAFGISKIIYDITDIAWRPCLHCSFHAHTISHV